MATTLTILFRAYFCPPHNKQLIQTTWLNVPRRKEKTRPRRQALLPERNAEQNPIPRTFSRF